MERFVEVTGGRLFAVDEGAGPPIVLIHAAIVDLRSWDAVVPGLLAAGYRVIRFDLRGFGQSLTAAVEYDERADLVAVLDAFGVERAAIVGNSRGGQIAFDTAIEHPDRIRAIVSLGSGPGGFEGGLTELEREIFVAGTALERATPADPDAIADLQVRVWVDGPGQPETRVLAAIRDAVRTMARPLSIPGHVAGTRLPMTPPANDRLDELACPVLAVVGAYDLSHIVKAVHRLEEAAPNARAVVWPDAAHMLGMEQPERLVALIAEFLAPMRPWT